MRDFLALDWRVRAPRLSLRCRSTAAAALANVANGKLRCMLDPLPYPPSPSLPPPSPHAARPARRPLQLRPPRAPVDPPAPPRHPAISQVTPRGLSLVPPSPPRRSVPASPPHCSGLGSGLGGARARGLVGRLRGRVRGRVRGRQGVARLSRTGVWLRNAAA